MSDRAANQVWTWAGGDGSVSILDEHPVLITDVGVDVGSGVSGELQVTLRTGATNGPAIRPQIQSGTTPGFTFVSWPIEGFVSNGVHIDEDLTPTGGTVTLYIYGRRM